jgi:hypothetical protein
MNTTFCPEDFNTKEHLGGLGVDGREILKYNLEKHIIKWTGLNRLRTGYSGGFL